ncbi:Glycosyltransferase involved in cell wall bisynthesis [Fictibacillus enclensis]|uniref:Glycosyl transferase family 1 domain-containing protein n=1 Tax=Fictibacillus enclensis TaxID=1017270 RepID=A0A0V8J545_9BACL|nr:glycosyltransferase family 4 protein [Fictibacillus enclensis]KSU82077.1 hypothetical protein AS030_17555 [Fictibacillus enclensis]SCC29984.1 Glycosyltransferase involved in cell wall bisynthesis [Fictibacillus enclensis]
MTSNNKKGIVSVGSKFHAVFTASALAKSNMLETFFVGKPVKGEYLNEENTKRIRMPLYLGYLLRKMPLIGSILPYNLISDILFDLNVRLKIKHTDFIVGFNNYCLYQIRKVKSRGTKVFLEQRIAHVNTEINIYQKEFGKIPSNLSTPMIKRKLKEYDIADYILVPSQFVYNSMLENGIKKEKLIYVPYGYDSSLFYRVPPALQNESLKLIFVGQIGYRKGVKYLLDAIANLKFNNYNVDLTLVGGIDKNFKDELKKYKDIYKHIDFISQNELLKLYNNSHIFILPSLCEGSAVVTYEALGCGLPLIVTNNTGSVIENKKEGLIVQPSSVENIETAIKYFLNNPTEIERMSNNALKKAKEYTWEKYGERLVEQIYQRI